MSTKRTFFPVILILAGFMFAFPGQIMAANPESLELTDSQINQLAGVIQELNAKQFQIMTDIDKKAAELSMEIHKEDRFETRSKEKKSVRKANRILKDISSLYGQLLKSRVEYLLKAKDVLTKEQKEEIISNFDIEIDIEEELPDAIEMDFLDLGFDLSKEQIKKILKIRTDMQLKELKIELNVSYNLLDLQDELLEEDRDVEKINKIIIKITDLGLDLLNTKVDHFIKAKDVLTLAQKNKLLHIMMMAPGSIY